MLSTSIKGQKPISTTPDYTPGYLFVQLSSCSNRNKTNNVRIEIATLWKTSTQCQKEATSTSTQLHNKPAISQTHKHKDTSLTSLRSFDAFAKPLDRTRHRSLSSGCITLLTSAATALLFLSQLYLYLRIEPRHSIHLPDSVPSLLFDRRPSPHHHLTAHTIPLHLRVPFTHLPCKALDYSHDGNSFSMGKFSH